MKKLFLMLAGLFFTGFLFSQDEADTAWKIKGDASLMFSQSSFTNWASGGDNNITINGFFNYYAGYTKGKSVWENRLDLAYGQSKAGERDFRKNEDKIDFLSTYGLKAAKNWFYSANFSFKSQFAKGYDYHDDVDTLGPEKISNFLAPAYTSVGIGMEYKPVDYLSFYLSPVTARWVIVNDQQLADQGSFGVEPAEYKEVLNPADSTITFVKIKDGKKIKQEFGAYFRLILAKEIVKNVNFSTKLELYSDYLDNPQNIDVNWDNMLDLKVNSYISANVGMQLVYDDNTPIMDKDGKTGPRTQIKEIVSVGLTYNFSNTKK